MSWLDASFFSRNFIRIVTAFVVLFAALPAKTGPDGLSESGRDYGLLDLRGGAESIARWMQPSTAAAAPRSTKRQRSRARSTKAQEKKPEAVSEQSASIVQPLTPFIQIWPHAQRVAGEPNITSETSDEIAPVAVKGSRLDAAPESEATIVHPDEVSEIDLAATPPAQSFALASTDGRGLLDAGERSVNRFSAFVEQVKALPQAPWFDSVLLVMGGVIAAFFAARMFVKA